MLFNESWLREWANPELDTAALMHQLTMAGLEVDGVAPACAPFSGVVVAEVLSTAPHPDADKLTLCQVHDGSSTVPVVCGAPNVRAGLRVAFARVGAVLPGDFRIKPAKLRGQPSEGMLCGASELGLEDKIDGLLELPADAPLGVDVREYLQLDDAVIEVDLTPNRADCLSLRGLAREVGVLNRVPVTEPRIDAVTASHDQSFPVAVSAPADCPRYLGRVVRGVNLSAPTPLWMVERLRRAGIRSIDAVVDVTNYVLLELGQPMHAFDLARLQQGIEVRKARSGEKLELLDGQSVTLRDDTLVIADAQGPLAMAGVMGGKASAVTADTTDLMLESAFFAPLSVAGKARSYGLHTDSSHRFERGVDPQLQRLAMERATALILSISGGEAGPIVEVVSEAHLPVATPIALSAAKVNQVLGLDIADADIEDMLQRLGMTLAPQQPGQWLVTAPSWRFDMAIEADLIEDVARVYGYDLLPSWLPAVRSSADTAPENRIPGRQVANLLVDRGYLEAITYSFVDPAMQQALAPDVTPLALANPISSELGVMRTTLWAGLLTAAQRNLNRQITRLRLFEQGLRFVPQGDQLEQLPMVAGLIYGSARPQHFDDAARKVDFFDLKGDVEALLALAGRTEPVRFVPDQHPVLHPGQSARVVRDTAAGEVELGWLGRIHPAVAGKLDLSDELYLFELCADALAQRPLPRFAPVSDQPSVRRDLAFVVDRAVLAGDVLTAVRRAGGEQLRDVRLFDVYQGEHMAPEQKSLALGLTFQDRSRTLGEADINELVTAVIQLVKQEFNASLRE